MYTKLGITLLGAVLALSGCGKTPEAEISTDPRPVKALAMGERSTLVIRQYPGRVIAGKRVVLAFQVNGPLIEFPVVDGQLVQQKSLLARIDPRDYQNRLNAEKADLNRARRDWERAKQLLASGTIAQAQYDKYLADYEITQARVATAQKALDDTYLYAPFTGLIANTAVENYQNVQAKEPILSLQDVSQVDIEVELPEQDMIIATHSQRRNARGMVLKNAVYLEAAPDRKFTVTIKEYETEADAITQTYTITLTMPSPTDMNILPGMTAVLTVSDKNTDNAKIFVIPVSALATDKNGQQFVWVINPDTMKISKRNVNAGELSKGNVHIHSGLKNGEQIVTAGLPHLTDDMQVRILQDRR